MRSREVTATARSLPSCISGSAAAETREAHRDRAGRNVGHRRRRAAIRHMQHVGARHVVHQFAGKLLRIADAGGGERKLAAIGARVGDEFGGVLHRRRGRDHNDARHDADERDGRSSRSGS